MRTIPVARPAIPSPDAASPPERPPEPPDRLDPAVACGLLGAHPHGGEAFWAVVRSVGTPLVDPLPGDPGRCAVTFVHPAMPDVASVHAILRSITEPELIDASAMRRVPGTDVWAITFRLDARTRGSYSLAVASTEPPETASDPTRDWFRARLLGPADPADRPAIERYLDAYDVAAPDPLAKETRTGGTSVMSLPLAPPARWLAGATEPPGVRHATLPGGREVWRYEPDGTDPAQPLPVVVLLDGEDWPVDACATIAGMTEARMLPPLLAIGVGSTSVDARWTDLGCDEGFVRHLAEDVLGWAAAARPITTDPARTIVAGQSLGGLAAVFATQLMPERFGCALAQSGSFWWPGPQEWLTSVVRAVPEPTAGVYLDVGTQEWSMIDSVRRMADALTTRGDPLDVREFCGGHDMACWRVGLADGLAALTARW